MKIRDAYPGTKCPPGDPEAGPNGCYADDQPEPAVYRCDMCGEEFNEDDIGCSVACEPVMHGVVLDPRDLCAVCITNLRQSFGEEVFP